MKIIAYIVNSYLYIHLASCLIFEIVYYLTVKDTQVAIINDSFSYLHKTYSLNLFIFTLQLILSFQILMGELIPFLTMVEFFSDMGQFIPQYFSPM